MTRDDGDMVVLIVVVLLALIAALAVTLMASVEAPRADGEGPLRAFVRGLRAGLRRPDAEQVAAARAAAAHPVDVSLDEMLRANVERGEGYVSPDEIVDELHEAAERVLPHRR
jgi:hypothetical protein